MTTSMAVQIEQATVWLTVDQIVAAVRQLDRANREQVLRALRQDETRQLAMAALNSPAAALVWDNPADAAAYDALAWEPGDGVSAR
jgi:hypothetical protein